MPFKGYIYPCNIIKVLAVVHHRPEKIKLLLPYMDIKCVFRGEGDWNFSMLPNKDIMKNIKYAVKLWAVILEYRPHVILSHGSWSALLLYIYARLTSVKFVMRVGGNIDIEARTQPELEIKRSSRIYSRLHYKVVTFNLKHADKVIVVSSQLAIGKNTLVIPTPCDIDRFSKPKINEHRRLILSITNANFEDKVYSLLPVVHTITQLMKERDDFDYMIIGYGILWKEFKEKLRQQYPGIYDTRLIVLDKVINIWEYYQRACMLVYYSNHDVCPNVVMEAWASKTPIIINNNDWQHYVVPDGTALIASDDKDLNSKIVDILDRPADFDDMIQCGWEYVNMTHSLPACAAQLEHMFRELAGVKESIVIVK